MLAPASAQAQLPLGGLKAALAPATVDTPAGPGAAYACLDQLADAEAEGQAALDPGAGAGAGDAL